MQERSIPKPCRISTVFAEDSLARAFQSLENGEDLTMQEELSSLKLPELPLLRNLSICSLKMFPACCRMTEGSNNALLLLLTFEAILDALDELGYDVTWEVLNSADHYVPQARKRVFIVGFSRDRCAGRVLSFTDANPKTLVRRIPGREGSRVYSTEGIGITLTSSAGGFGGKTGLYTEMSEDLAIKIKSLTAKGYQLAYPGDSIDLAYADMNSRRGRVGHDIAHTVVTSPTQGYYEVKCIDMNAEPDITEIARCITTRQDSGIGHHKGEKSGVLEIDEPIPIHTPFRENARQQGRRFKSAGESAFTITSTDRDGVIWMGFIRKLTPRECWRLQGFTDEQFDKVRAVGISKAQLYKQAGNAVTVTVIEALGRFIRMIDEEREESNEQYNDFCE